MKINKKILFLVLLAVILILPFVTHAAGEFCSAVSRIQTVLYQVGGSIVIIGWVVAGILYLTSAGSPEKTGTAKKAMIAAIIGTILIIVAASASIIVMDAINFTTGAVPTCP